MTTGALIFAYNNEQTDYVAMAAWTAKNIRRHLGIPVALVTDRPTDLHFEQVIIADPGGENGRWFGDYNTNVTWHNKSRVNAYELTPWKQTLVLDADYVVASDQLQTVIDSKEDFLAHRWAYDITNLRDFTDLNHFGNNAMPMWWATVMMFRRSDHAQLIFKTMEMVRDNWTHYRNIYKNSIGTYRNDHALSIALGVVNGHTLDHCGIPWNLASLTPDHQLTQLAADHYRVDFLTPDQKPKWIELHNQDFHAMGKKTLGEIVANPC
jgi:hypothetical protein